MRGVNILSLRPFSMEKILGWVVTIIAFIFPVAVLTVNRADSVILLLLGMIGTYAFLKHGIIYLALSRQEILLIGIFFAWYAVIVLCYFTGDQTDTGFKLLGRDLRLLFVIPVFIACRRYLTNPRFLFVGLVLAPFGALFYGLWQFVIANGDIRASGVAEVIPFGDLSMAMGFMALALLHATDRPRKLWQSLLAGAALTAGIVTSILSGTRGGWIVFPVLLILTIFVLSENSSKRRLKILFSCCVVVLLAILLSPGAIIRDRVGDAIENLSNYRGYLKLIDSKDITRHGCLNEKSFLDNLARQIEELHITNLNIAVIKDDANLVQAGFGEKCQSGYVIRVTNENKGGNLMFRIQRVVPHPKGDQTAQFIVRGQGRLTVLYGYDQTLKWTEINNTKYLVVEHAQNIKELSWPDFRIPSGSSLYFVPIQNFTGEYVFPFVSTSVGERFEMWRAAWHIFKQHPMLGAGTGSFLEEVDNQIRSGDVFIHAISYDHPHNDFLNALSGQGLLGLVLYLSCMGYPLILYSGALRTKARDKKAAGFTGVIMISSLLVFGLTETMFIHSIVMSWYVTFTAMLMAIIFRQQDTEMRDVNI